MRDSYTVDITCNTCPSQDSGDCISCSVGKRKVPKNLENVMAEIREGIVMLESAQTD